MFKLKPRLVDDGLIDDRRFCKLNTLFAVLRIIRTRRQVETADILQASVLRIVVTSDQRVVGIDLIVDSRAERGATARNRDCINEPDDIVIRIKQGRDNDCLVVDVAFVEVDKEGGFLLQQWATEVSAILPRLNRRPRVRKRVA